VLAKWLDVGALVGDGLLDCHLANGGVRRWLAGDYGALLARCMAHVAWPLSRTAETWR
jgi:hypothetical protein